MEAFSIHLISFRREMLMRVHYQDDGAGCTKFLSRVLIQRERELLASDGAGGSNETGILTNGCIGIGADSSSCSR